MGQRVKAWRIKLLPIGDKSAQYNKSACADRLPIRDAGLSQSPSFSTKQLKMYQGILNTCVMKGNWYSGYWGAAEGLSFNLTNLVSYRKD